MREVDFIKENKEKWREYDEVASNRNASVESYTNAYHDLLADLAYANTKYPDSRIRIYLSNVAKKLHEKIYTPDKFSWGTIKRLFAYEVPYLVVKHRKEYIVTSVTFILFVILGVILQLQDINAFREIVGNLYVDETIRNIEAGEPCAVYGSSGEFETFFGVTFNNLMVCLRMYASGLFPFVGPLRFISVNGIMLGEFQTFFFQYDAGFESMTSIWIHGSLEIPSILIEATAAIILSYSIVFPGSYSRWESIKRGGVESMKVLLTALPVIVIAGFMEGYIARRSHDPLAVRLLIIFTLFSAWLYYYVYMPFQIYKKNKETEEFLKK